MGDVHGEAAAFAFALATDRFIVQLGDLTDYGPDSAGALRQMLDAVDAGSGLFLMGNHDHKLGRALLGHEVRMDKHLAGTLAQLDEGLRERTLRAFERAPLWLRQNDMLFVHAGFHTDMLEYPAPTGIARPTGAVARALYGLPTGRTQPDGYPERSLAWVDRIPRGLTVYCGHDRRSIDGRPYRRVGRLGGEAVFLDTGAGKGGHLAWIDL